MVRGVSVLLILLASGGVASPQDDDRQRRETYNHAWLLYQQTDEGRAMAAAKDLIRQYPTFYRAFQLSARVAVETARSAEGESYLKSLQPHLANAGPVYYGLSNLTNDPVRAEHYLQQCLKADPGALFCQLDLGLRLGQWTNPESRQKLAQLLASPAVQHDVDARMEVLRWIIGSECSPGGSCEVADTYHAMRVALAKTVGDWEMDLNFCGGLATTMDRPGREDEVLKARLECVQRSVQQGAIRGIAGNTAALGEYYEHHGEPELALEAFRQEFATRSRFAYPHGRENARLRVARAQRALGDLDGAQTTLEQGLQATRAFGFPWQEAACLRNLSLIANDRGDYFQALQWGAESAKIFQASGYEPQARAALGNQGEFYTELGDWKHAREMYQQSLDGATRYGDYGEQTRLLGDLAALSLRMGMPGFALQYGKRSLAMARYTRSVPDFEVTAYSLIAEANLVLGRIDDATSAAQEALRQARHLKEKSLEAGAHVTLASVLVRSRHREQAASHYESALRLSEAAGSMKSALDARQGLAAVWVRQGRYREALAQYQSVIDSLESLRSALHGEQERYGFLTENWRPYEAVVQLLAVLHRRHPSEGFDAQALAYAERARARSLLDSLEESHRRSSRVLKPDERRRLASAQTRLTQAEAATMARDTEENRHALREARRALRTMLPEATEPAPLDARRIQTEIVPRTGALIEYSLGAERSSAWFVGSHGLRMAALPAHVEIERLVKDYRRLLISRPAHESDYSAYQSASRQLYEILLAPFSQELAESQSVVIIPDGILHYLPFETLLSGSRFLIETHSVSYVPSASVLASLLSASPAAPPPRSQELLAYANPEFSKDPAAPPGGDLVRAVYHSAGLSLAPLPNTQREAESIAANFPPEKRTLRTGAAATESSVKTDTLTRYRRLHFATHAILDEREPARSGIVLSLTDPGQEDGILRAAEVANLKLNADLVVLSACQTGLGKLVTGEGMLGLTRSFLYAGARRVVVSLWQTSDVATPRLMEALYRHNVSGASTGESLRAAKLAMLHSGVRAYQHPYYWAPFVLVGLE